MATETTYHFQDLQSSISKHPKPRGINALILPAISDLKESWYGIEVDKTKYRIVLEDETEQSVYLRIVKIQPQQENR